MIPSHPLDLSDLKEMGGCLVISGASYKNNPLVMDERMKPGYPDELFLREDIVKTIDTRWIPYFGK